MMPLVSFILNSVYNAHKSVAIVLWFNLFIIPFLNDYSKLNSSIQASIWKVESSKFVVQSQESYKES